MEISEKEVNLIIKFLQAKINPDVIYLFGSVAKGQMHSESDIDIAYLGQKKLNAYEIFMIAQGLADKLKMEVDLVDLEQSSTVFQAQVIGTGKVIYCGNQDRRMLFEMVALKKYARLNEERKVILDKIRESGSIYG